MRPPTLRTGTAKRVLNHVSARTGVSVERIHERSRDREEVAARRRAARLFHRLGYGLPDIGIALQRHHTTVLYHVCGKRRGRQKRGVRA